MTVHIGITSWPRTVELLGKPEPNDTVPRAYVRAVQRAGALPILLPLVEEVADLVDAVDGIVVAGGGDVDPARYGAVRAPETAGVDPARDEFDHALWHRIFETGTPALGVCRGLQMLNVVHGGTLLQHLPEHPTEAHHVTVEPGTGLWAALGEVELETNSLHHQAVDRVGDGLVVTARAADGTVEGLEVTDAPHVLAVQWHPELLRHRPAHASLFADLVRRAGSR